MKTLLSILIITLFTTPAFAEEGWGELDGTGLECEITDKKYEQDEELKHFVFEKGEVYWLVVTDGTPAKINKLSHGRYFTSANDVRWYPYILNRKTLRLDKLRPTYPSRQHDCEIKEPKQIEAALQKQIEALKEKMKDNKL